MSKSSLAELTEVNLLLPPLMPLRLLILEIDMDPATGRKLFGGFQDLILPIRDASFDDCFLLVSVSIGSFVYLR